MNNRDRKPISKDCNLIPDNCNPISEYCNLIPDDRNLIPEYCNLISDGRNLIPEGYNPILEDFLLSYCLYKNIYPYFKKS